MDFEDRRVLITGSTRGIGLAAARAFLERGARVAVNGRSAESVSAAIDELGGARLVPAPGSIDTAAGCAAVVEAAVAALGGLDVLVNNAGVYHIAAIAETDEAMWDEIIDVNVKGSYFCSRAALPALKESKGNIVNLGSTAGLAGYAGTTAYCASKGAVVNLTRALALELVPQVRVNCVCPTATETEMGRMNFPPDLAPEAARAAFEASVPMKRLATVDEVAAAILFLASEEASFITGAALPVDGARTAGG